MATTSRGNSEGPVHSAGSSSFQGAELELARQWLGEAARVAGLGAIADEFTDRVFLRLDKGAEEYGSDNYLRAAIDELMSEGAEEGDDIAGWALVTAMRIYRESERMNGQAELIQGRLLEAAALGLRAWWAYREARELVAESRK